MGEYPFKLTNDDVEGGGNGGGEGSQRGWGAFEEDLL